MCYFVQSHDLPDIFWCAALLKSPQNFDINLELRPTIECHTLSVTSSVSRDQYTDSCARYFNGFRLRNT